MFSTFKHAVEAKFNKMQTTQLFIADIDKDTLWDIYLNSFPEGSNPIFRTRTQHDCQCCKQFIRHIGGVVTIDGDSLVSVWDINIGGIYQVVADALSLYVKSKAIQNVFTHFEKAVGKHKNFQLLPTGDTLTFEHFCVRLPDSYISAEPGGMLSENKSTFDVFLRGLQEITVDALDTVLELIDQGSLYRGEESRAIIATFKKHKEAFSKLSQGTAENLYVWKQAVKESKAVTRIRNNAIGTLLVDMSNGIDINTAVAAFESKVAPQNYKRPTALVTKSMIDKAKKEMAALGLLDTLDRRPATARDISINNIIFADREAKPKTPDVFDAFSESLPDKGTYKGVEEVSIEKFLSDIVPKAKRLELLLDNKHSGNMVSLITETHPGAGNLFKWDNPFSWDYVGNFADSIKTRVKNAGGNVTGDLRCSLSWDNASDLDLHMLEPTNDVIYYGRKHSSRTGGTLDVDMNASDFDISMNPVENICYPDRKRMVEGVYKLQVQNFKARRLNKSGFVVEIEFDGIVHNFEYDKKLRHQDTITVAEIEYRDGTFNVTSKIPSTQVSKILWGISTQKFHKVNMLTLSPNYWGDQGIGNKHYFFMLDNCVNDGTMRGFFNEYLRSDLAQHRKVFEIIGSKVTVDNNTEQLSGLGFSSTKPDSVLCRVTGSFIRVIKIVF